MPRRKSKRKHTKRSSPASRKSKSVRPPRVGPAFAKLVAVMARLRAPNGCPWDREQTHATLRTYLIEEAYEVLDALDGSDDAKFAEELGDLLLQVLFHAQIAHEEGRFSISDVISEIYEKMIRRHPHVFGDQRAKDAAEVLRNWEIIKAQERLAKSAAPVAQGESARHSDSEGGSIACPPPSGGSLPRPEHLGAAVDSAPNSFSLSVPEARNNLAQRTSAGSSPSQSHAPEARNYPHESLLDGVPRTLPALLEAYQLTRKAARIGFDWHNLDGIFAKLLEETGELRHVLAERQPDSSRVEAEVGDILFVAVNLARFLNLDPEIALKKSSAKFSRRFREMERIAREQGTTLAQVPRSQMESLWDQVKLLELSSASAQLPK